MITQVIIDFFTESLTSIFQYMPSATTLPSVGGFDVDTALSGGMSMAYTYMHAIWPLWVVFQGFLFILGYHLTKLFGRLIFGSRWPL
jgi:hypothetical protein